MYGSTSIKFQTNQLLVGRKQVICMFETHIDLTGGHIFIYFDIFRYQLYRHFVRSYTPNALKNGPYPSYNFSRKMFHIFTKKYSRNVYVIYSII